MFFFNILVFTTFELNNFLDISRYFFDYLLLAELFLTLRKSTVYCHSEKSINIFKFLMRFTSSVYFFYLLTLFSKNIIILPKSFTNYHYISKVRSDGAVRYFFLFWVTFAIDHVFFFELFFFLFYLKEAVVCWGLNNFLGIRDVGLIVKIGDEPGWIFSFLWSVCFGIRVGVGGGWGEIGSGVWWGSAGWVWGNRSLFDPNLV